MMAGELRPGWYDDGTGLSRWWDGDVWTEHVQQPPPKAPAPAKPAYVVLQVVLTEKVFGPGSSNLPQLERTINEQAARGYRLHSFTTSPWAGSDSSGHDHLRATMVFERLA